MKSILEIIYALLVGLIGDDVTDDVQAALTELKKLIDELEDETKSKEELAELENKIQAQLTNLLPKVEGSENKAELAKLKNQIANMQLIMLDNAIKNLGNNAVKNSKKIKNAMPYEAGKKTKLVNLIDIDNDLIPSFIEREVVSQVPDNANFMSELLYMGNHRAYVIPIDTYNDNEATARAGAWAGNGANKSELVTQLKPKRITTQPLYVLAGISWEELELNGGMIPKYRVTTTLRRWMEEYMRAILVGDGRNPQSDRHIKTLVPIKRDATDDYCTVIKPTAPPTIKSVREAIVSYLLRPFEAILVANAITINKLQEVSTTTGVVTYMSDEELAKMLKIKKVVANENLADNEIAIFRDYRVIGVSSPSTIEDYDITTNTDYFEVIGFVGGDLGSPKSALWINAPAPEVKSISIDPTAVTFAGSGGTEDITVTASGQWTIALKPNWITEAILNNTVTLTAATNTGAFRTDSVVFALVSDETVTAILHVSQSGA